MRYLYEKLYVFAVKRCDRVIAVSGHVKELLVHQDIEVITFQLIIMVLRFACDTACKARSKDKKICFSWPLYRRKRHHVSSSGN